MLERVLEEALVDAEVEHVERVVLLERADGPLEAVEVGAHVGEERVAALPLLGRALALGGELVGARVQPLEVGALRLLPPRRVLHVGLLHRLRLPRDAVLLRLERGHLLRLELQLLLAARHLVLGALALGEQLLQPPLRAAHPATSARATGLFAAVGVGLFGGSILVPLAYLDEQLAALPSFGLGALLGGALLTSAFYAAALRRGEAPALELRSTLWAGLLSGLVWNAGNLCQIIAMGVYALPYGIAYPILQAALMVSGLLGIFVFREIVERPAIIVFFTCAGLVVVGAVLLGLFGPGTKKPEA